jgi:CubicO group peptidase (beta-lactamase class C family)
MNCKSRIIFGLLFLFIVHISISQNTHEIIEKLEALIEKAANEKRFSGSVMVTYNGDNVYTKSVGLRNIENNQFNLIDTKFNVGSMNKMHTAVLILQLVQNDKLRLDDRLIDILTDYPNKEDFAKVTIHHLLTHTSGFGDYLGKIMAPPKDKYQEINDYLPLITSEELLFEPGERFSYSNAGFMILGAVIEEISGRSYFDYVQQYIFDEVGMNNTGFDLYMDTKLENLATNYTQMGSSGDVLDVFIHPGKGGPAGGGYSTVADWLKFGQALESCKLLDEEHIKLLTEGKVKVRGRKYAYGFFNENIESISVIGHGGGAPGINGEFEIYKGTGYSIAILGNLDPPAASIIKNGFRALLFDQ